MNVKLIKLTREYEKQLGEMIDEWREDQERNHTDRSPGAIFKNDYRDFDYYLEHLERKTATADRVPDSVFFLLDVDRDRLLGAVNIRHRLNDALILEGGHIGDGIRPTERGKGYATEMIRLALIECRKLGIDRVLMTCDRDNVASARTIIKNGGVLENEIVNSEGIIEQRYWIENGPAAADREIVTPRLRLAALRPEDREALIALFTDGEVGRTYMVPELSSEEEKTALFERLREMSLSDGRFFRGIYLGGRLIGIIHEVERDGGEIELGYAVSPAEKCNGYAAEALSAAVSALISEGFSTVKAGAFSENAASMRVMEKCGMTRTGETEQIEYRGKTHTCVYYAIGRDN